MSVEFLVSIVVLAESVVDIHVVDAFIAVGV